MKKILLLLVIFSIYSCSRSGSEDNVATSTPILPTKITTSDGTTVLIKYNGDKITEMDYSGSSIYISKEVYQYTGDNITKLTEYDTSGKVLYITDYTYTANKMTAANVNYNGTVSTTKYENIADDHIKATLSSTETEDYYYTNSNLTKKVYLNSYYSAGQLISYTKNYDYTFDNMNSPFKNVKGLKAIFVDDQKFVSANNSTKSTYIQKDTNGYVTATSTSNYTYDYKNNYPIKASDGQTTINYEYNQ